MGSRYSQRNIWGPSSPSHRLSDGLYSITSTIPIRPGEMTELSSINYDQKPYIINVNNNNNNSVNEIDNINNYTRCTSRNNVVETNFVVQTKTYYYESEE